MGRLRGLGFGVIVVALTVGVIAGVVTAVQHIPRPAKKIEWVQREDAVIVQMKSVYPGVDVSNMVPDLTLYGDGTLIMRNDEGGLPYRLFEAKLSTGEVRSLLKSVNGTGFFNFNYAQPEPERTTDRPTTYLFVQTKEVANAVSAYALDSAVPDDAGKQWVQFRKAQEIKSRLDEISREAMANGPNYTPDAILLTVERTPPSSVEQALPQWPFPDIDLARIAPESGLGEQRIEGALAREVLDGMSPINGGIFLQGAQRFTVGYRPVLPYEENFPEFEPPSGAQVPEPGKEIEWVRQPEAVVVQMKVNGFQLVESNGIDPYVIVPEFTLYGDGTLIASKTGSKCPCPLVKAKLSNSQVEDLLRYIDDSGFFNFSYIEPGGPGSFPTTYIYAAMKNAQNISGRHFGLATCIGDCTPPSHYRTLGQIEARLEQVIEETVSTGTATDYWADSIVLSAKITNVTIRSTPPEWPLPQVDLATIANGSDFGSRRMEGDLAKQVQEVLADYHGETDYLVNGQWYAAGYRPALPYEDHFPEFDTTQ